MTHAPHTQLPLQSLLEANQAIWSRWFDSVQSFGTGSALSRAEQAYQQQLDQAEQAVKQSLETQAEWLSSWRQGIRATDGLPPLWAKLSEDMCALSEQWLDARTRLWSSWFDSARSTELSAEQVLGEGRHAPANVLAAWQDVSRRMLEQHSDWLRGLGVTEAEAKAAAPEPAPVKPNGAGRRAGGKAEAKSA